MHVPVKWPVIFTLVGVLQGGADAAVFDFLFPKKSNQSLNVLAAVAQAGLSTDQITQGLKEALAKGVTYSITNLGRDGGYLNNLKVRIPVPDRTNKALDGLFVMIAEEEQRLRENLAARTTDLLKKVFDSLTK